MDAAFWRQRWENDQIAFHQDSINPFLQRYWPQLGKVRSVLVPLAGKSADMIWLSERGHQVLAVELSEIAVAAFFNEHRLTPKTVRSGPFQCWKTDRIQILCGDFFALDRARVQNIDAVYDRASLIALPRAMRPGYVDLLVNILPARTPMLLITLEYPQHEMNGPPFSVTEQEVHTLYGDSHAIQLLNDHDALAEAKRFREKGLTALREKVYRLDPKDANPR